MWGCDSLAGVVVVLRQAQLRARVPAARAAPTAPTAPIAPTITYLCTHTHTHTHTSQTYIWFTSLPAFRFLNESTRQSIKYRSSQEVRNL